MKKCNNCGKELIDEAIVCTECGCSSVQSTPVINGENKIAALSIVSIVIASVGIVMAWLIALLGYLFGGASLACSIVAINKYPKDKGAKVGLALSIAVLVCALINSILGVIIMMS